MVGVLIYCCPLPFSASPVVIPLANSLHTRERLVTKKVMLFPKLQNSNDGTHNYLYDQLYRLIDATHPQPQNPAESFDYDPVGNRLTSTDYNDWTYDVNNRLVSYDGVTYTYDNNQARGSGLVC